MKVKFEVVVPLPGGKFAYYPMKLDHRLIKTVHSTPGSGGSVVEMITGQKIHANQAQHFIYERIKLCRAFEKSESESDEVLDGS